MDLHHRLLGLPRPAGQDLDRPLVRLHDHRGQLRDQGISPVVVDLRGDLVPAENLVVRGVWDGWLGRLLLVSGLCGV